MVTVQNQLEVDTVKESKKEVFATYYALKILNCFCDCACHGYCFSLLLPSEFLITFRLENQMQKKAF